MIERGEDKFYYNEDFIIVGNLKISTFKYPPKLVKLLGFETEIIHNSLEEWERFYKIKILKRDFGEKINYKN